MDVGQLTAWLRLPQRARWALTIVAGLMLWGPDRFIDGLGLQEFIDEYRIYLGVVFLVLLATALPDALQMATGEGWRRWQARRRRQHPEECLSALTEPEKDLVRRYINEGTRTQNLEISDGVASGLVSASVLYRASDVSIGMMFFPYNMQPWAWEYIQAHPEVLSPVTLKPDDGS